MVGVAVGVAVGVVVGVVVVVVVGVAVGVGGEMIITSHIEHLHYRGVGITIEQDHLGLWWSKALMKIQGPCKERSEAEARAQDWVDSRGE